MSCVNFSCTRLTQMIISQPPLSKSKPAGIHIQMRELQLACFCNSQTIIFGLIYYLSNSFQNFPETNSITKFTEKQDNMFEIIKLEEIYSQLTALHFAYRKASCCNILLSEIAVNACMIFLMESICGKHILPREIL